MEPGNNRRMSRRAKNKGNEEGEVEESLGTVQGATGAPVEQMLRQIQLENERERRQAEELRREERLTFEKQLLGMQQQLLDIMKTQTQNQLMKSASRKLGTKNGKTNVELKRPGVKRPPS